MDDARAMRGIGASSYIFSSDQGLMRQAGARILADFQTLK
jgi:hypothetical protein